VGGGVAGISAACALADAGVLVHLLEKRPLLGGRASSWMEHETGERLDACQHGTMRCCTNLAQLLDWLGVHDQIRYHRELHFVDGEGVHSILKAGLLPAPGHMSGSFLRFRSLSMRDKWSIARGMMAMLRAVPAQAWGERNIGDWFLSNGQTERAVRRFWEPVLVSACNESLDRISCTTAFKVFRDGFLATPNGYEFGIPRLPLGSLYTEPAVEYLRQRDGTVSTRTTVKSIVIEQGRAVGVVLKSGDFLQADVVISGLQFDLLPTVLPQETSALPYFRRFEEMETSPICGVHVWFDRPLDAPEALALLDRRTDWIFHKNRNFDLPADSPAYLSMVISEDREIDRMTKEETFAAVLADVHAALPAAKQAQVCRWHVLKERKATFSPKPGTEAVRPDQRSPLPNLYVAGEWTNTGWPSTMESAARSGFRAAEYALADLGRGRSITAPDLEPAPLVRLLMG
jgi:zeta-carotene desaturase